VLEAQEILTVKKPKTNYNFRMGTSIAITGATGLLGSNLANKLILDGNEVYALIKDEQSKSILSKQATRVYGDINNKSDIEYFVQKSNPEHFIHLAAQTQAYDSLKYPYQTFYNNIVGTINILESLREYSQCKSIIVASSDKAYGELKGKIYKEDHQLKGIYPYDASKSATDLISNSYRETYSMPIIITRACNIFGVGDFNKQRLIPGIIEAYTLHKKYTIRNKGEDIREYIHVDDVVSAYQLLMKYAEEKNHHGAFNISSGESYSTIDLFNLIQDMLGSEIKHEIKQEKSREIKNQFMDASLLKSETGWVPKNSIVKSLGLVIKWYQEKLKTN
jgi:CDP-glucose 4,6-dehydratase